jgi:hypothetical protein
MQMEDISKDCLYPPVPHVFAENLAKFCATLKYVLSMAYGDTARFADLTTKLVCVKLALARGECYYTFSALLGDSNPFEQRFKAMVIKNRLFRVRLSTPYIPSWRRRRTRSLSLRQSSGVHRTAFTTPVPNGNRTAADYAGKLYAAVAT